MKEEIKPSDLLDADGNIICPKCGALLRAERYGSFYGCSNYKAYCRFTLYYKNGHWEYLNLKETKGEALHKAIKRNDSDEIMRLMQEMSQNSLDEISKLLIWAAQNNNVDVIQKLLGSTKVDINARSTAGYTLLEYAAAEDSLDVMKLLFALGATPQISSCYHFPPLDLMDLCDTAKKNAINNDFLLDEIPFGIKDEEERNFFKRYAYSISNEYDGIRWRPNLNEPITIGKHNYPVIIATAWHMIKFIKLFLKDGVDLKKCLSTTNLSALDIARENHFSDIEKVLIAHGCKNTPLSEAAYKNDIAKIDYLLSTKQCNVNEKNDFDYTALIMATLSNSVESVKLLISGGASVNAKTDLDAKNQEGMTALMLAANANSAELVELLLEYGASPELEDDYGWTAYDWAESAEVLALLDKYKKAKK